MELFQQPSNAESASGFGNYSDTSVVPKEP